MKFFCLVFITGIALGSCGVTKQIRQSAQREVLRDASLQAAHVGISIYEPATGKRWYDYQGDKYFVPASNTKLPTCYAAMKYLGDSWVGLRYNLHQSAGQKHFVIQPTGDPTFLHPDFVNQPTKDFLQRDSAAMFMLITDNWKEESLGSGWTWNDYAASYMAERSSFPIYGNVIRFSGTESGLSISPKSVDLDYGGKDDDVSPINYKNKKYSFTRDRERNIFRWDYGQQDLGYREIPFITSNLQFLRLIRDTLKGIHISSFNELSIANRSIIHSQPTDSLLRPMMHRSDNFFAEQSLLMVSNERLNYMSDAAIIDTILKTDLADLPQKPRWADGSGLSRYNLFTPQDFVAILNKMKSEFGMARIKEILPTGGEGTLSNFYKADSTFIYAKTGTLSGVVALSGFLYTKGGKELIFSVLVNNHQGSATAVRRAVEKFVQGIRQRY